MEENIGTKSIQILNNFSQKKNLPPSDIPHTLTLTALMQTPNLIGRVGQRTKQTEEDN